LKCRIARVSAPGGRLVPWGLDPHETVSEENIIVTVEGIPHKAKDELRPEG
jgi:hypothetical protein